MSDLTPSRISFRPTSSRDFDWFASWRLDVPFAPRCKRCNTLVGSWVRTHHAPGAKPGDKPCRGSWDKP